MKRFIRIMLLLCAAVLALFALKEIRHYRLTHFDEEKEGIADVVCLARFSVMSRRTETETKYYSLASGMRMHPAEPFEPDRMTVFTVPYGCFESYIDKDLNKVLNRLNHMALTDTDGKPVSVDETQAKVFSRIAELEHDMFVIRFMETGGQTFVYLEQNVNLWTPCLLYWYDREADQLVLLHKWDAEEVIGLRVRNITLAR